MRGLYFPSNGSIFDFLRPMFVRLDSLYWIVDCQSGPVRFDWIYESREHERIFEDMHIEVPAFESTSTHLWRPGSLALVQHELYFDEWSYLVGFESTEEDAVQRATRIGFPGSFTPQFYLSLEREAEICLVQGDGWWEIYPTRADLFSEIQAFTSCREIATREHGDWMPEFV